MVGDWGAGEKERAKSAKGRARSDGPARLEQATGSAGGEDRRRANGCGGRLFYYFSRLPRPDYYLGTCSIFCTEYSLLFPSSHKPSLMVITRTLPAEYTANCYSSSLSSSTNYLQITGKTRVETGAAGLRQ